MVLTTVNSFTPTLINVSAPNARQVTPRVTQQPLGTTELRMPNSLYSVAFKPLQKQTFKGQKVSPDLALDQSVPQYQQVSLSTWTKVLPDQEVEFKATAKLGEVFPVGSDSIAYANPAPLTVEP